MHHHLLILQKKCYALFYDCVALQSERGVGVAVGWGMMGGGLGLPLAVSQNIAQGRTR